MAQSWLIWNGFDCRSKGVLLDGPVAIVRPEERVQHIQIPGRSGDLTQLEGEDIYNSYIQTATILVHGGYRVREIYRWLRGAGYVTFSGEPDKRQAARIIGAITLNKHSYNLDWWTGEVQFYCQPLKELLIETPVTVTSSGATIRNNGDVECRPLYKVTVASGKTSMHTRLPCPPVCRGLLKFMSIELVLLSSHIILCHLLLLPSIFPSIRVNGILLSHKKEQYWVICGDVNEPRVCHTE